MNFSNFTSKKIGPATSRPKMKGGFARDLATDPFLDWMLILAGGFLVAVVLVGAGVSVYLGTEDRLHVPDAGATKKAVLPLSASDLTALLGEFESRADERGRILKAPSIPRDPSLP